MLHLMAGENIPERVVRKVFASSIDLVIHLERDVEPKAAAYAARRWRSGRWFLRFTKTFHPSPCSGGIDSGGPLEWTGSMPPQALIRRLERALPEGANLTEVMEGEAGW